MSNTSGCDPFAKSHEDHRSPRFAKRAAYEP